MIELEVAIDLIVPDNTAYTVLVTLRELGYDALERVERSEIIRLSADAQPSDAANIVERLMHAEILFNPNKHRLSYTTANKQAAGGAASPNGAAEWEALVMDRDDETSGLVQLLRGPFVIVELRSLSRGVAWRLYEAHGPAPKERIEWASRQLLANPYSQTFVVRPVPARVTASPVT